MFLSLFFYLTCDGEAKVVDGKLSPRYIVEMESGLPQAPERVNLQVNPVAMVASNAPNTFKVVLIERNPRLL